nr:uncharacterized protein LOC110381747 [Helicoverpa armigera]
MKTALVLVSFLLASFSHGVPLDEMKIVTGLKAPKVYMSLSTHGDTVAFYFSWDKVVSDDPTDPVIGYTAYLWEINQWKAMEMNYLTGKLEEIETEPKMDDDILPDGIPMIVTVPANDTYAPFRNLKRRVCYEIRVKAFTKTREGPFSSPTRHKVLNTTITHTGPL